MQIENVTLTEIIAASRGRHASLVPESAGYLILGIVRAMGGKPQYVCAPDVVLNTEGVLSLIGQRDRVSPSLTAEGLHSLLTRMLDASQGKATALRAVCQQQRHEPALDTMFAGIRKALIPINRGAAKRALARLARETLRARSQGRLTTEILLEAEASGADIASPLPPKVVTYTPSPHAVDVASAVASEPPRALSEPPRTRPPAAVDEETLPPVMADWDDADEMGLNIELATPTPAPAVAIEEHVDIELATPTPSPVASEETISPKALEVSFAPPSAANAQDDADERNATPSAPPAESVSALPSEAQLSLTGTTDPAPMAWHDRLAAQELAAAATSPETAESVDTASSLPTLHRFPEASAPAPTEVGDVDTENAGAEGAVNETVLIRSAPSGSVEDDGVQVESPPTEGALIETVRNDGVQVESPPTEGALIETVRNECAQVESPPTEGALIETVRNECAQVESPPTEGALIETVRNECAQVESPPTEGALIETVPTRPEEPLTDVMIEDESGAWSSSGWISREALADVISHIQGRIPSSQPPFTPVSNAGLGQAAQGPVRGQHHEETLVPPTVLRPEPTAEAEPYSWEEEVFVDDGEDEHESPLIGCEFSLEPATSEPLPVDLSPSLTGTGSMAVDLTYDHSDVEICAEVSGAPAALDSVPAAVESVPAAVESHFEFSSIDDVPVAVESVPVAIESVPVAIESQLELALPESAPIPGDNSRLPTGSQPAQSAALESSLNLDDSSDGAAARKQDEHAAAPVNAFINAEPSAHDDTREADDDDLEPLDREAHLVERLLSISGEGAQPTEETGDEARNEASADPAIKISNGPGRVEDLLASFGEEEGDTIAEATASLKRMMGLEPTPPPSAIAQLRPLGLSLKLADVMPANASFDEAGDDMSEEAPASGISMTVSPTPAKARTETGNSTIPPTLLERTPSDHPGRASKTRKWSRASTAVALLALSLGGGAVFYQSSGASDDAFDAIAPTSMTGPEGRCVTELALRDLPAPHEVMLRLGGELPLTTLPLPTGVRLELVATANGHQAERIMVAPDANWQPAPDGSRRLQLDVNLVATDGRSGSWPSAPDGEVGGIGAKGRISLAGSPAATETWLVAGVGNGHENRIVLGCEETAHLMVVNPNDPSERRRISISPELLQSAAQNGPAEISMKP